MVAKDLWKAAVAHHKLLCEIINTNAMVSQCRVENLTDSAKALEDARQGIIVIDPSLRAELADFYPEPEKGDE